MNKTFWERTAFLYDTAMKKGDAGDLAAVRYITGFLPDKCRLLEAACGTGRFACALAPYVAHLSCSDYAENMVRRAEQKAARLGLANLDFSVQDITALRYADASFDAAVAANVLHLLPEPERAIKELVRVIKPGGLLFIPNYVNADSTRSQRRFLRLIRAVGFAPRREWTKEQFLAFVRAQGLRVQEHAVFASRQPLCVTVTIR